MFELDELLKLAVTFIVGIVGGVTAKKLKFIPAAFMLGSLILVAAFNLTVGYTYFTEPLRVVTQILAGSYLGLSITKESLYSIRSFLVPIVIMLTFFLIFCLAFGFLTHNLCGVDLTTAFYCFAPGGVSDLAIIADSVGGDVAMITFMQLIRLITVFIFYPFLYQIFAKKGIIVTHKTSGGGGERKERARGGLDMGISFKEKAKGTVIALTFTTIGGLIGFFIGLPAGAMVMSMVFAVTINVVYRKTYMPIQMRFMAQIMSGIYLALRITPESIALISQSMLFVVIMILSVVTFPLLFGYIVHKLTKLELGTSFFCCTPGGMSEMTLLAEDMGLDFVKVSIAHLARAIIVVSIFPQVINLILRLVE